MLTFAYNHEPEFVLQVYIRRRLRSGLMSGSEEFTLEHIIEGRRWLILFSSSSSLHRLIETFLEHNNKLQNEF